MTALATNVDATHHLRLRPSHSLVSWLHHLPSDEFPPDRDVSVTTSYQEDLLGAPNYCQRSGDVRCRLSFVDNDDDDDVLVVRRSLRVLHLVGACVGGGGAVAMAVAGRLGQ